MHQAPNATSQAAGHQRLTSMSSTRGRATVRAARATPSRMGEAARPDQSKSEGVAEQCQVRRQPAQRRRLSADCDVCDVLRARRHEHQLAHAGRARTGLQPLAVRLPKAWPTRAAGRITTTMIVSLAFPSIPRGHVR